jgi:hypothetical protein
VDHTLPYTTLFRSSGGQNQRIKKRARVVAVPDQRSSSVAVTATKDLMEQVEAVVMELDANTANLKSVAVFKLENAEPQDALQVLQDIFQKNGTPNSNSRNQNQNNALQNRSTTQNQQYNNTTSSRSGVGQGGRGVSGMGQ